MGGTVAKVVASGLRAVVLLRPDSDWLESVVPGVRLAVFVAPVEGCLCCGWPLAQMLLWWRPLQTEHLTVERQSRPK